MSLLTVREVTKSFAGVRAVDGVSFSVKPGSITGLLGRNGAGKTTTIRMITGILLPDSGTIEWSKGDRSIQDRMAYLPEERGLYRQMKVVEELVFLAEIKGRTGPGVKRDIARWLDRFELTDKKDAKVEELSKGNQQKVQLIGTLLHEPDLIVLDEPQSGLDPVNMLLVRNLLRELRDQNRTILLSTHMMDEAERLADDIILIHQGKIVLEGPINTVRSSFAKDTIFLEYEGDAAFLRDLPQVRQANILNHTAEITLSVGADPQELLKECVGRVGVRRFEVSTPSLERIFIEKVGAQTLDAPIGG